jgi:hypothetical protein
MDFKMVVSIILLLRGCTHFTCGVVPRSLTGSQMKTGQKPNHIIEHFLPQK